MCDKLYYSDGPCINGHVNENGLNLRFKKGASCCQCRPSCTGLMDEEIELRYNTKKPNKTKNTNLTPEEELIRKRRRSENSMRWSRKNKDKVSEYQKRYYHSGDVASRQAAGSLRRYNEMDPELKKQLNKERYQKRKAIIVAQRKVPTSDEKAAHLLELYERRKARERAKYASMTPEDKAALLAKRRERAAAKALREKKDD